MRVLKSTVFIIVHLCINSERFVKYIADCLSQSTLSITNSPRLSLEILGRSSQELCCTLKSRLLVGIELHLQVKREARA